MRTPDRLRLYFANRVPLYDRVYSGTAGLLARRWWRPLVDFHRRTLDALPDLRGRRVLEIGCGTGHLATAMAQRGATVLGLDLAPEMVNAARRRAAAAGMALSARFEVADFDEWPPSAVDPFDVVVALGVMDYCPDPPRWLGRMRELGGDVIATFPGPMWPVRALRVLNQAIGRGVPLRFYRRAAIETLLAQAGLTVRVLDRLGTTTWVRATRRGIA